jgi:two-component system, sensor histidine kinase and response regulator
LASCGGNASLLRKMCQTLRAHIPGQLATVRTALRAQDAGGLRQAAHRIRGTLSQFSTVVSNLAGDLEELAAGQELDKAASTLERLEAMAGQLHEQVDGLSVESLRHRISGLVS